MFIKEHFPTIQLTHVINLDDMYKSLKNYDFDILLLDMYVAGEISINNIPDLKAQFPKLEIIVISGQDDVSVVLECIRYGTSYLMKGAYLETDLIRSISNTLRLIESQHQVTLMQNYIYQEDNFPWLLFKMDNTVTEAVLFKNLDKFSYALQDQEEIFLQKLMMFVIVGLGQGDQYNTGLYALPASSMKDHQMLVYSFRMSDKNATDHRLKIGYFIFCVFFPVFLRQYLPNLQIIQEFVDELFAQFDDLESITEAKVKEIRNQIITYLRNNITIS